MWDLSKHERLEMEALDGLNTIKALGSLIFCGGTMLRLCHELNRYSVDLDFWLAESGKKEEIYKDIKVYLEKNHKLKTDSNKGNSVLFEFNAKGYHRNLKIEIRESKQSVKWEERIAFSKHSTIQVLLKTATLEEMMKAKIETFLDRIQIRDAFDIEFLLRRGININASEPQLKEMDKLLRKFKAKDYKITLGALLDFKNRQYYKKANFRHLLAHIKSKLSETVTLPRT